MDCGQQSLVSDVLRLFQSVSVVIFDIIYRFYIRGNLSFGLSVQLLVVSLLMAIEELSF